MSTLSTPTPDRAANRGPFRLPRWSPVVPAVIYLIIFMVIPLAMIFGYGFFQFDRGRMVPGSFTFHYYWQVLTDPFNWRVFARTLWMGALTTLLCLVLGYPVAYMYTKAKGWVKDVMLVMVMAPLLTNAVVRTFGWMIILGKQGFLNALLVGLGILDEPVSLLYSFTAVIIGLTQVQLPFMVLPLISALSDIDHRVEEAAANMGASPVRTFFHITVPMSMPGILAGSSLVFVISYTNFAVPALLGGGNFVVAPTFIQEQMMVLLDWSKGAVISSLLLGSSLLFIWLFNRLSERVLAWKQ